MVLGESDIDTAAQLLELTLDGDDDEEWRDRFKHHADKVMGQHTNNILSSGSGVEQRTEYLRAKLQLHEIIFDRIVSRTSRGDRGASEALNALRAVNAPLIEEACGGKAISAVTGTSVANFGKGGLKSTGATKTASGGASAFAAAIARERATASQPVSPRESVEAPVQDWGVAINRPTFSMARESHSLPSPRLQKRYAEIHAQGCHGTSALNGTAMSASRPGKDLSLRQLRHVMNSLYESKAQQDTRCNDLKEPNETMEQHLYGYLTRRYGVRSVVQEWAQAIFRAINRWGPHECDVAVFGKILQNSLAESFQAVQDTLRQSVHMLLKKDVQMRNANRPQAEVEALWRARVQRGVPFVECEKVVRYMYNERDSDAVLHRLKKAVAEWAEQPKAEADSVRYRDLVQILLRFQMELTEGFLADFVRLFTDVDTDEDGIVSQDEMKELMARLSTDRIGAASVAAKNTLQEAMLHVQNTIRAYNRATFSECVDIFTGMISARWAISREAQERKRNSAASRNSAESGKNGGKNDETSN